MIVPTRAWLTTLARLLVVALAPGAFAPSVVAQDHDVQSDEIDARTRRSAIPAAYHEFRVFGGNTIYLSHYSMFASIHAYQVIFEAKLSSDGIDAGQVFHDFQRDHPERHLTLSPSQHNGAPERQRHDWVLPEEIKAGHRFNADLHWVENPDDFSDPRARRYVATNISVEIVRVIHFRMFYPDNVKPRDLVYFAFGQGEETYLAHRLEAYPDFDHIVRVRLHGPIAANAATVHFKGRSNTADTRLKAGEALDGELIGDGGGSLGPLHAEVLADVHFEELDIQK